MELVCGPLIAAGFVDHVGSFAIQRSYPFARVTVEDIAHTVLISQIKEALRNMKISIDLQKQTVSRQIFAERVAEQFVTVGASLIDVTEVTSVVRDVVIGIRAHIDPLGRLGSVIDNVPKAWRDHPKVVEYATCLPFLRAALTLPSNERRLDLSNEFFFLDRWLKHLDTALKESDRYQLVSKAEALRHHGLTKVRDLQGKPVTAVLKRSIAVRPQAQAVLATQDVSFNDDARVYEVRKTSDRIARVVEEAYGKAPISTDKGADVLTSVLGTLASYGYVESGVVSIDATGTTRSVADIAALLATRVFVTSVVDDVDSPLWVDDQGDPVWLYEVATVEQQTDVSAGAHFGDLVHTLDPVEAILAAADFQASQPLPDRPQLFSPAAFGARVVNLDLASLQPITASLNVKVSVNGLTLATRLRAIDFATWRSTRTVHLVKPFFNAGVSAALVSSYRLAFDLIARAENSRDDQWKLGVKPGSVVFGSLRRSLAMSLLYLSHQLSAGFRDEVQNVLLRRTVGEQATTSDEVAILRNQLTTSVVSAHCDLVALLFFFHMQGIDTTAWQAFFDTEEMAQICQEVGSDRKTVLV